MINPAYAGSLNVFSSTFTNRNQWLNVDGAPVTQNLTAHNAFKENQVGVGLNVTRDAIGVHAQHNVYGSFAYKIRSRAGILSMGLQAGFDQWSSDFNRLKWFDGTDNFNVNVNRFTPNFGTGLYFANRDYFLGASIPYILTPKVFKEGDVDGINANGRQSRYYYLNGGFVKDLNRNMKINPSALVRLQDKTPPAFDINVNLIFGEVVYGGISYRHQDSFALMTQLVLNENFRFGYAYDIPTNSLRTTGSHEFFLNYRIKLKIHKKDGLCPVYF